MVNMRQGRRTEDKSTTDEAPGRDVSFICPLFFFLVSYSPFCQSACLLKKSSKHARASQEHAYGVGAQPTTRGDHIHWIEEKWHSDLSQAGQGQVL